MGNAKEKLDPRGWELATWKKFFVIAGLWNFSFAILAFLMPGNSGDGNSGDIHIEFGVVSPLIVG